MCSLAIFVTACASTNHSQHATKWSAKRIGESKLPEFDIPIVVNDRVVAWLDYFQGAGRGHFARYLARSGRHVPVMQDILKKYAMPQDLVYIALIESGFSARAYSRAHAVGHWQFIKGTGRHYGLAVNNWVDERRDPHKATVAAARYLRDLFDEFGDWYLAMAAYNAGEGKIRKAIQRTGTRNFWEMIERDRRYLRAETKDYVPKFIAAAILAKSPERFGFGDVVYEQPVEVEKVKVDTQTDLQVVARCAEVGTSELEDLNPELIRGTTPPSAGNYEILLPKGAGNKFEVAFAKLPPSERLMVVRHQVRRGDTAGRIAKRYGVSVRELLAANGLRSAAAIKRGTNLVIPTGGEAKEAVRAVVAEESGRPRGNLVKHRVQRGETLGLIAQNYGVNISSVKTWNRLRRNMIHEGQTLKIYSADEEAASHEVRKKTAVKGGVNYTVRRGDSWLKVAQKYGISINELKGWNSALAEKDLRIGQKLKLFALAETPTVVSNNLSGSDLLSPVQKESPNQSIAAASSESELLSMRTTQDEKTSSKSVQYTIKNGDTLWDIAKKYGVSVKSIQDWNNLGAKSHKRLRPGNVITLKI